MCLIKYFCKEHYLKHLGHCLRRVELSSPHGSKRRTIHKTNLKMFRGAPYACAHVQNGGYFRLLSVTSWFQRLFLIFVQYLGYITVICCGIILVKYIYNDVSEYQHCAYMEYTNIWANFMNITLLGEYFLRCTRHIIITYSYTTGCGLPTCGRPSPFIFYIVYLFEKNLRARSIIRTGVA